MTKTHCQGHEDCTVSWSSFSREASTVLSTGHSETTRHVSTCLNSLNKKTAVTLSFPDNPHVNTTIILSPKKFKTIHKVQDPGHALLHNIQTYGRAFLPKSFNYNSQSQ